MSEMWRDIEGYEGYYQVSDKGNIRSMDRYVKGKNNSRCFHKGADRKLQVSHKGYFNIILQKEGKKKQYQVHRLVAQAFIPNLENKPQVNHIDCNKQNNGVSNLEWATQQENMDHAKENNLFGETSKAQRKAFMENIVKAQESRKKAVRQYDLNGVFIKEYHSIAKAAKKTGTNGAKISMCCRGQRNKTNNFNWEYSNTKQNQKECS